MSESELMVFKIQHVCNIFLNFGPVFDLHSSSSDAFDSLNTQFIMSQEIACVCLQTADVMNLIQLLKNPQWPRGSDRRALFNWNITKKEGCRIQICLCDVEFPCLLRAWCKCTCITGYVRMFGGCPLISLCSGNMLIQPAIFLRGGRVPFFSHQLVSMELMGPCLCPPVYSMGDAVGSLERLHHLLLPGRRWPVQGETFFWSSADLSTHLQGVNISYHKYSPLPEGLVAGSGRRE